MSDIELYNMLVNENVEWQEIIYNETGVCVEFDGKYFHYYSACGFSDVCIDNDESINSIENYIASVKASEEYERFLRDISLGQFSKSELFFGFYDAVIFPKRDSIMHRIFNSPVPQKDGTYYIRWDDYLLKSIWNNDSQLCFEYDLCDYLSNDSCIGTYTKKDLYWAIQELCDFFEDWMKEIKENNEREYAEDGTQIMYEKFAPRFELIQPVPNSLSLLKQRFQRIWKKSRYVKKELVEMGYNC